MTRKRNGPVTASFISLARSFVDPSFAGLVAALFIYVSVTHFDGFVTWFGGW
jgi:hypothetical protein